MMLRDGILFTMVLAIMQTVTLMLKPASASLPVLNTCKDICECDSIVLEVDCTGKGLDELPNLKNNTRALILDENNFAMIEKRDFVQIKNLRHLSLANNTIDEIERNSFVNQRKVLKLNLNGNRFGEVPIALEHMRQLKILSLSNNQIRTLSKEPWCNLTRLERLHLDYNGIPNLPLVMTSRLNKLIELSVSHNNITAIPVGQFFNMSNLEYLDLSYNQIATTSTQSSSYDFDDGGAGGYYNLASDIPTAIPDLEYVVDDMAEGIVADSFKGLSKLRALYLKGNQIEQLMSGVFDEMVHLQTLLLDDNGLQHIHADVFRNNIHLRYLSLGKNELSQIPLTLFEDLRNLEVIILDHNYITDLAPLTNVHMFHLRKLSVNHNRIKSVAPPGFQYFYSLREMYFSHNKLTEIPFVKDIRNLTIVDLGYNRIKHIWPVNVFENTSIREIYIQNNRLLSLDFNTFAYLEHLEVLDVTGYKYICDCKLNWVLDYIYEYEWMFMPNGDSLDKTMACQFPRLVKELTLYQQYFLGITSKLKCTEYVEPHRIVMLITTWGGVVAFFLLMFWTYVYFDFKRRFYVRKPRKRYLLMHNIDETTGLPYHHNHPYTLREQAKVRFRSCESDTESLDMLNSNFDEETTV